MEEKLNDKIIFEKILNLAPDESYFHSNQLSKIHFFETIDSTNLYAKQLLENSPDEIKNLDKTIVIAESQTAGRGRLGRKFYSPAKTGIYLSLIYAPQEKITNPAKITAFAAVALLRVINRLYKVEPKIKWINDLFLDGKKIAGILTEGFVNYKTGTIDAAVIGIGVNLQNSKDGFPEEISKVAGSIQKDKENPVSKNDFVANLAVEISKILKENPELVLREYKNALFILGTKVQVHPIIDDEKSAYEATAIDIDENANLIIRLSDGSQKSLNSGEITLHSSSC